MYLWKSDIQHYRKLYGLWKGFEVAERNLFWQS